MSADGTTTQGLGISRGRLDDLPGLQDETSDVLRRPGGEPAAGPGDGERSVLARAAALRFPDLRTIESPRERVDALIDHITATAIARGDVEELRLEAQTTLHGARRQLDAVGAFGKTKAEREQQRRDAAPAIAERVDGARWLIDRCTEQIERLGGSDYDAASRSYTLLSGG